MAYHEESAEVRAGVRQAVIAFAGSMKTRITKDIVSDTAKTIYTQHPSAADMATKWGIPLARATAFRTFYEASVTYFQACTSAQGDI